MTDGIQVSRETGHKITGAVGAVKSHVLTLDLVIQIVADPVKDSLGYVLIDHAGAIDNDTAQDRKKHHGKDEPVKKLAVRIQVLAGIFPGEEKINDLSGKIRDGQL